MEFLDFITNFLISLIAFVCHLLATLIITIGIFRALIIYMKKDRTFKEQLREVSDIKITIGNSFSLALSILVGASILKTVLNPSWNEIGMLTSIILLRTFLNTVLMHNLVEDEKELEDS
ncbi:MAG: DUF1622 domain-containing protein [Candidatus Cloacimonetes bacterium]|nr:DUF1622 domain-containing protein [Candidatus Cloacimonadota bacterium]